MRRFHSSGVGSLLILLTAAAAVSATPWKNHDWQAWEGSFLVDSQADRLTVSAAEGADEVRWGSAVTPTSAALRALPTQEIEVTVDDPGFDNGVPLPGPQLVIEEEDRGPGNYGSMFRIGAWQQEGDMVYRIAYADYDEPYAWGFVETTKARTAGQHRFGARKRADGAVEFFIDGELVYTHTLFAVGSLGNVYLACHGAPGAGPRNAVFTDLRTNEVVEDPGEPGPLEVRIDFLPGVSPNVIHLRWKCMVPLAILSAADFNALNVVPSSVKLNGGRARCAMRCDINRDGRRDLILWFNLREMAIDPTTTVVDLIGVARWKTPEGGTLELPIHGSDTVVVLPRR